VLRVTTLKSQGSSMKPAIDYYVDLATDQHARDGISRGPADYYLDPDEPPGRWWGEGRDALGLDGDVEAGQLRALLEGRHPRTGHPLGRGFGIKSARGFDATFSAPKSVSVLWALSPDPFVRAEALAAHDAAVTAALGWLETHGAVSRRGTDGVDQVDTRGLTVALFRQHTSRSVDPQLHTHAVISSKVQDRRGRWFSLDARFLKYQQRGIGWIYDAALRAELTHRLGLSWGPVEKGHADIAGIGPELRKVFSQRSAQLEATLAGYLRQWWADHDGADPDARTIAGMQRKAALASRPDKAHGIDAPSLRAEWVRRARAIGLELEDLPGRARARRTSMQLDRAAVIGEALGRVEAQGASWLQADLAREIATLVPAGVTPSGTALTALVDELADEAAGRCAELHPAPQRGVATRRDGRPISEHVVDRRLSTSAVLDQESRMFAWAKRAVVGEPSAAAIRTRGLDDAQLDAARAVAGDAELVLVVGPAGTGKTTMLATAVDALRTQGREVLGVAPSGKAADVLAREARCPTMTVAKLLAGGTRPGPGATVILDEAGMVSTDDLEALTWLAGRERWRLACVGDPYQLPAVGRGGVFADWCNHLPAVRLGEIRRFAEPWEAPASLALRAGDARAAEIYARRHRLRACHPALVAKNVARLQAAAEREGATLAITTASQAMAREVNLAIQLGRRRERLGRSAALRDGTEARAGDRVATRRNDARLVSSHGAAVRNRQVWEVRTVKADGSVVVADPERGSVVLPASYVAEHLELGWAVTGYGNQGVTADFGICVVEPTTSRAGLYVGMTRGRQRNDAFVLDPIGTTDPAEALAAITQRPLSGETAHAVRSRLHGQDIVYVDPEIERARRSLQRVGPVLDRGGRGLEM